MKKPGGEFIPKLILVTLCAFVVFNFSVVGSFAGRVVEVMQPVLIGVVLALAMCVPLRFFKYKLFRKIKKERVNEFLSLSLTFLLFAGVLTLLGALLLPQGANSVREIVEKFTSDGLDGTLSDMGGFFLTLKPYILKAYAFLTQKIATFLPQIISALQNVFTGIYNVVFGAVIAIMLVVGRKTVKAQLKKVIDLLFKKKNEKVKTLLLGASEKFSRYLGGQLTEACIFGSACYLTMSLLRVPGAALVSLIMGFANLIPIIGAYVGGTICTVLVLATDPAKAIVFLVALLVLQQVEGFTTYPVIVGKYVGLNGFWTTVSVLVFGGIFGFWGMFFGVPLAAFAFELFDAYYARKKAEVALLPPLSEQ